MSQNIYKRLTVIFYEKDKECYEAFKKLSEEREESMTKIARKLISAELEKNKKGEEPLLKKCNF